jgi:hypothetical protein
MLFDYGQLLRLFIFTFSIVLGFYTSKKHSVSELIYVSFFKFRELEQAPVLFTPGCKLSTFL